MRLVKTNVLKIILFGIVALLPNNDAHALDEFKTEYDVTYDNLESGETLVTQDITITNLKDDVIATNYTLTLKQIQIYDVTATDERGEMDIEQTTNQDTTTIVAEFNENTVGKGRSSVFKIQYKTKDIATKIGEIYTIKIPKVAGLVNVREYEVELIVPEAYGPRIFITPEPNKLDEKAGAVSYFFNRDLLENSGISASFGKYQVLNYNLKYQLKNNSIVSTIQEIALPPDIRERQQVSHKKITPEPKKVYADADGNLIAQYVVKPREELEIELIGTVRILGRQINTDVGGRFSDIDIDLSKNYTKAQPYWETTSTEIQTLKNKLHDPEANVSQNAKNIYNYVVQNLDYDHAVIERDYVQRSGAVKALNKEAPAACMEFTDLFIATARAMGIPARELNGYAINVYQKATLPLSIKLSSGDLLHAWPEYYDPNFGWVPVDPTWGNTSQLDFFSKLDNSHFVFSIKGLDSEFPLPAGLYRNDTEKELVSVEISEIDSEDDFKHNIGLYKRLTLNPLQLIAGKQKYYIQNQGGTYLYSLSGENVLPFEVKSIYLEKELDTLRFEDTNGKLHTHEINIISKNPKKYLVNPFYLIFSILLGLLLCSSIYYFLILKGFLKKLPFPRLSHPQDQDQTHNQRS